ncbi:amidohydrolase family protein [Paenibacillus sp. GSMTC-2017]|nr:amidohydrolase family protein [Paenibacillus sp. GSMTC-2017]
MGVFLITRELFQGKANNENTKVIEQSASAVNQTGESLSNEIPTDDQNGEKSLEQLVKQYDDIPIFDAHNHNAGGERYRKMMETWDKNSIERIVLFGAVSSPDAVVTDKIAWEAYLDHPDRFIPFFSGVNLLEESGLQTVKDNLEKGYFGIGEIAAASTYSPILTKVPWKTAHPMDGILPQIYELCAQYQAPLLLHIDPLDGLPISKLKEALMQYPDTTIILAHANAYNTPGNVENLLEEHPNLYVDFFAGFTAYNADSTNKLDDFIPIIKKYPNRILLSTDSGFGLNSELQAIDAIYRLIDLLNDRVLAKQIAYDNLDALIARQPATATQLKAIEELKLTEAQLPNLESLSKLEAAKIINAGRDK